MFAETLSALQGALPLASVREAYARLSASEKAAVWGAVSFALMYRAVQRDREVSILVFSFVGLGLFLYAAALAIGLVP